jgi:hypothetical protein
MYEYEQFQTFMVIRNCTLGNPVLPNKERFDPCNDNEKCEHHVGNMFSWSSKTFVEVLTLFRKDHFNVEVRQALI